MANPADIEQAFIASVNNSSSSIVDAVATSTPLLAILRRKGRIRSYTGPKIEERILYGRPDGMWFQYYDIFPTKPTDILTKAEFTPKQLVVPIVLSGRDIRDNSGPERIFDLFRGLIDAGKASAREIVYQGIFSDGTANGGKQITGLKAMLPDNPALGTYAGISRANWTFWRPGSYDVSSGTALPGQTTLTKDTVMPILRNVAAKHSTGTSGPDLLLVSPEWASAIYAAADNMVRLTPGDTATLGFNTIKLNLGNGRTVEMAEESGIGSAMPADTAYLLDTDSISLRYHPDANWKLDEQRKPLNQDAVVAPILWQGEMTMSNARYNAKITI